MSSSDKASNDKPSGYFLVDISGLELDRDTLENIDRAIKSAVSAEIAKVSDVEGLSPFALGPHTMGLIMR